MFSGGEAFNALEDGAPDGRKAMSVAISDGDVAADGTAGYWAAIDAANSRFLAAGPVNTPKTVIAGQKFRLDAFAVHLSTGAQ
jgi:hypothetical protein